MLVRNLRLSVRCGVCCCAASSSQITPRFVLRPVSVSARTLSSNTPSLPTSLDSNALLNSDPFAETALENTVVKLADFGLGNVNLPSGWVQHLLDALHNCGLEWWQTVVALSLVLKTVSLPWTIHWKRPAPRQKAQWMFQVTKNTNSRTMFRDADKVNANITKFENLGAIQCQIIPLTYFFGIRGMTKVPFPGWETGGVLWFPDLTTPDLTLAVISGVTIAALLGVNTRNPMLLIGAPLFAAAFISFQPSALGLYWCCSNMYSLVVALVCKTSIAKSLLGLDSYETTRPGIFKKQSTTSQTATGQIPGSKAMDTVKKAAPAIKTSRNADREAFRAARTKQRLKDTKSKK